MLTEPAAAAGARRPRPLLLRVVISVAAGLAALFLLVLAYALTVGFPSSSQTFVDCHDGRGPQRVANGTSGACTGR